MSFEVERGRSGRDRAERRGQDHACSMSSRAFTTPPGRGAPRRRVPHRLRASAVAARASPHSSDHPALPGHDRPRNVMTGLHLELAPACLGIPRPTRVAAEETRAAAAPGAPSLSSAWGVADRRANRAQLRDSSAVEVRGPLSANRGHPARRARGGLSLARVAEFDALRGRIRTSAGSPSSGSTRRSSRDGRVGPRHRARLRPEARRGDAGGIRRDPAVHRGLSGPRARCSTFSTLGLLRATRCCATCRSASRRARSWRCSAGNGSGRPPLNGQRPRPPEGARSSWTGSGRRALPDRVVGLGMVQVPRARGGAA